MVWLVAVEFGGLGLNNGCLVFSAALSNFNLKFPYSWSGPYQQVGSLDYSHEIHVCCWNRQMLLILNASVVLVVEQWWSTVVGGATICWNYEVL